MMLVWFRFFRLLIDESLFQHEIYIVKLADTLPLLVWGYVEKLCCQPPVPMTILQERLQLERSKVEQVQIWVVGRHWGHIERFMCLQIR